MFPDLQRFGKKKPSNKVSQNNCNNSHLFNFNLTSQSSYSAGHTHKAAEINWQVNYLNSIVSH